MHVLLTTDTVGGVWTYALDLAAGRAGRGDTVTLAVLGPSMSTPQGNAAEAIKGVRVVETGAPLDWTALDPGALAAAASAIAALAKRERADVVHLNSPALAAYAQFSTPVVSVAHSCLSTWWEAVRGGEPPQDFRWRIEATARGYRACDAVIAPSVAFAHATTRAYDLPCLPTVVRNGRALPQISTASIRDIPIITAGRLWDDGKDAASLDTAAARLDVPVMAVGPTEGPHGQRAPFVHLQATGALAAADVARVLSRSRIFCSSAVYEPFGLSVLEAAQAGCALVLSDIPTFRELWEGAAIFTPPHDPAALADALKQLSADERETARLGAAAQRRARRYGLDDFVDGTASVYAAALRAAERVGAAA